MEEIIEYFGMGFLYMITVIATIEIVDACIRSTGIIYTMVAAYMQGICG